MQHRRTTVSALAAAFVALGTATAAAQPSDAEAGSGRFQFTPIPGPVPCGTSNAEQPFVLPPGYAQEVFAREGAGGTTDLWDMNTQNEDQLSAIPTVLAQAGATDGPHTGRFLYRAHEVTSGGQVSVTDLDTIDPATGEALTRVLVQRPDWERLDGMVWTPWGTILTAEETSQQALRDPAVPQAQGGLVYEIDPVTGTAVARPALGARANEGMRFDAEGNFYGISETRTPSGGFIYRFTPDRRGDLSTGTLYALKVTAPTGDRTGEAVWVPLDDATVQVNSDATALAAGATSYDRPEDVEIATSTGNNRGGANVLYVAVTEEDRVLRIDLREPRGGRHQDTAFVSDYVRAGVNVDPAQFDFPDNLALDHSGNLYITEDQPSPAPTADDIWMAEPGNGNQRGTSARVVRFASLPDCAAEPTGIYFDVDGGSLYVNAQHRSGDGRDLGVRIHPVR